MFFNLVFNDNEINLIISSLFTILLSYLINLNYFSTKLKALPEMYNCSFNSCSTCLMTIVLKVLQAM